MLKKKPEQIYGIIIEHDKVEDVEKEENLAKIRMMEKM
jgi:hypothetical protein